jgi:spermidine/putrescine transport system permease protein
MKKICSLMSIVILVIIVFTGCGKEEEVLNFYNWSEYMPQELIDQFEEETGIKVNYATYSSNEEMFAKVANSPGSYDLIVSSDYMVDIMIKQDHLEKIDFSGITNIGNIGESYMNRDFDPGNLYTVPYMAGSALIAVNTELIDFPIEQYEDLWNEKLNDNMVVLDDQRALIGITLKKLGYSMNTLNPDELEQAKQELLKLKDNIKAFDSDSPKSLLISGEVAVGYVWNAEAVYAKRENPAIQIVMPEEGLYLWQDNFAIPKGAKNKANAEKFIEFLLRPEISKVFSEATPYTNPNKEAYPLLSDETKNEKAIFPDEIVYQNGEFLKDVGEATVIYDEIWTAFKQE